MIKSGVCRQIFATLTASLCMFITGMWLGWPSSAVEKFIKHETDFNVDTDQLSWIVSMMDLGNVISPLFAGYLMDKIGRKPILVLIGPLFMITWLLTIYVPSIWSLYTARLLAGLGKGMSYTVLPVYLGEIADVNIRGALSSVFSFQLYCGLLLEVVVGPMVSYRTLNSMSAFFPIVFILLVFWIPESPFYLLKQNRQSEAAQCLVWLRSDDWDVNSELQQMEISVKKEMENKSTFSELFSSRKYLSALMVVLMACVSQRAGGVSCMSAYSSIILPESSSIMGKSWCTTLFFLTMVVIQFMGTSVVDKVGRKPLVIISELGTGMITFVFALYFYLRGHEDVSKFTCIPYLCYILFSAMFALGVGFIPMVFLGELFPVNIRSLCSAIATITMAACSFISNKIFLSISLKFGYHVMFGLFTVINVTSALYSYMYAIETKGKTFLEIQDLLEASGKSIKIPKDK